MAVYTLFSQAATGTSVADDFGQYSFGVQFSLSQSAKLTGIWFNSPSGSTALPDASVIYLVSGNTQVGSTLNSSPSWSGAAGSGWVKVTYDGSVTLAASTNYKAVVHVTGAEFKYGATSHYWDSGAGSGGITSGIITAPNNAGADGGQDSFIVGSTMGYPNTSFNAANYWVDVEVTTAGAPVTSTGSVALAPMVITAYQTSPPVTTAGAFALAPRNLTAVAALSGIIDDEAWGAIRDEANSPILDESFTGAVIPAATALSNRAVSSVTIRNTV